MRLNKDYALQEVGSEWVLVPTGAANESFHGVVRLNGTAAFIVQQMRGDADEQALVDALLDEYEVDTERALASVRKTIATLEEVGAVVASDC